jgi:glycosyltransferase involved in cell wall biosynthesis
MSLVQASTPRVSVVIPLYNSASSIEQTVRSVLAQTEPDFELIIVNDGSKDDGPEIVRQIQDPRIRLVDQENQGVSVARNTGIALARAPWVAFLDADDEWNERFLERCLEKTVQCPEADVVFSNVHDSGTGKPRISVAWKEGLVEDMFEMCLKNSGHSIKASAVMIRRSTLTKERFVQGMRYGEDRDLFARLAFRAKLYYTPEVLAVYHSQTAGSAMKQREALARYTPAAAVTIRMWDVSGDIPPTMRENALKFANSMFLNQAKRLISIGDTAEARKVLLEKCDRKLSPRRYFKLLALSCVPGKVVKTALTFRNRPKPTTEVVRTTVRITMPEGKEKLEASVTKS